MRTCRRGSSRFSASLAMMSTPCCRSRLWGQDDDVVWRAAQANRRFLVTQDLDFSDVRQFVPGTHFGLLLVRLPQPGRSALFERVSALFREEDVENWARCLVTATPTKVRVRRPEPS
jgi:predicted nuclease of predicted toxin-antitoxin system